MKKRNLFKLAALTAVFALGSMFANAQTVTGNITKQDNADPGTVNRSVKVIDNKGTVKYIQSSNGITTLTNTTNDVTTTFQLGGTLTSNTTLTLNTGVELNIQGLQEVNGAFELVVIDAAGNLKQLALTDIINAGTFIDVLTDNVSTVTYDIDMPTSVTLESYKTVYVFRNGAKLLAGVDYTIDNDGGNPAVYTVTIHRGTPAGTQYTATPTNGYEPFPLYAGDRIEVQFIK